MFYNFVIFQAQKNPHKFFIYADSKFINGSDKFSVEVILIY